MPRTGFWYYTTDYIPFVVSIPKFNKVYKLAMKFSQTRMGNGMGCEWRWDDPTISDKGWFDMKVDVVTSGTASQC